MEIVLKLDNFTVTGLEDALRKAVASCPLAVSVAVPPSPLTNLDHISWDAIDRIGKSGNAQQFFALGATKHDHMKDGYIAVWQIIGFNHDDLADGSGKAPISWDMVYVYKENRCMNECGTNKGGFITSDAGKWLNGDFLGRCSDELQAIIKPVIKLTSAGGGSSDILREVCKVWLKSEVELYGRCFYSASGEGHWYDFYKQEGIPYYKKDKDGDRRYNLLRSPSYNASGNFCRVNSNGNADYTSASYSIGLAPALCT